MITKLYTINCIDDQGIGDERLDFSGQYGRGLCKILVQRCGKIVNIAITCDTAESCDAEFDGQYSDGILENVISTGYKSCVVVETYGPYTYRVSGQNENAAAAELDELIERVRRIRADHKLSANEMIDCIRKIEEKHGVTIS